MNLGLDILTHLYLGEGIGRQISREILCKSEKGLQTWEVYCSILWDRDRKQDLESKHVVNKEAEDKTVVSCFSLTTLPRSDRAFKNCEWLLFHLISYTGCSKTFKSPEGEGKKDKLEKKQVGRNNLFNLKDFWKAVLWITGAYLYFCGSP